MRLQATDISKNFGGVQALKHVNVDIVGGEVARTVPVNLPS